jgi:hypothetical protein
MPIGAARFGGTGYARSDRRRTRRRILENRFETHDIPVAMRRTYAELAADPPSLGGATGAAWPGGGEVARPNA